MLFPRIDDFKPSYINRQNPQHRQMEPLRCRSFGVTKIWCILDTFHRREAPLKCRQIGPLVPDVHNSGWGASR